MYMESTWNEHREACKESAEALQEVLTQAFSDKRPAWTPHSVHRTISRLNGAVCRIQEVVASTTLTLNKFRNQWAPINTLPAELLCRVFQFCLEDIKPYGRPSHPSVINSHVCAMWRSVSIAHSALWSTIDIDSSPHLGRLTSVFAERSASRPLVLKGCVAQVHYRWLPEFYDAHLRRARVMEAHIDYEDEGFFLGLDRYSYVPLKNVEELSIRSERSLSDRFFGTVHLPNVRNLSLYCEGSVQSLPRFRDLTVLSLEYNFRSFPTLLEMLRDSPGLTNLDLNSGGCDFSAERGKTNAQPIRLGAARTVTLAFPLRAMEQLLSSVTFPAAVETTFRVYFPRNGRPGYVPRPADVVRCICNDPRNVEALLTFTEVEVGTRHSADNVKFLAPLDESQSALSANSSAERTRVLRRLSISLDGLASVGKWTFLYQLVKGFAHYRTLALDGASTVRVPDRVMDSAASAFRPSRADPSAAGSSPSEPTSLILRLRGLQFPHQYAAGPNEFNELVSHLRNPSSTLGIFSRVEILAASCWDLRKICDDVGVREAFSGTTRTLILHSCNIHFYTDIRRRRRGSEDALSALLSGVSLELKECFALYENRKGTRTPFGWGPSISQAGGPVASGSHIEGPHEPEDARASKGQSRMHLQLIGDSEEDEEEELDDGEEDEEEEERLDEVT